MLPEAGSRRQHRPTQIDHHGQPKQDAFRGRRWTLGGEPGGSDRQTADQSEEHDLGQPQQAAAEDRYPDRAGTERTRQPPARTAVDFSTLLIWQQLIDRRGHTAQVDQAPDGEGVAGRRHWADVVVGDGASVGGRPYCQRGQRRRAQLRHAVAATAMSDRSRCSVMINILSGQGPDAFALRSQ